MNDTILFTLNGKSVTLNSDIDRSLLWVLSTDYGLTGTKYGGGVGHRGSSTVLVDNEAQQSCQLTLCAANVLKEGR